jgi:hypothetical protein
VNFLLLRLLEVAGIENMLVETDNIMRQTEDRLSNRPPSQPEPLPWSENTSATLTYGIVGGACLQFVLFLLFLRSVARYFGSNGLAAHLLLCRLSFVGLVFLVCVVGLILRFSPPRGLIKEFGYAVRALVVPMAAWFLVLVLSVRRLITRSVAS